MAGPLALYQVSLEALVGMKALVGMSGPESEPGDFSQSLSVIKDQGGEGRSGRCAPSFPFSHRRSPKLRRQALTPMKSSAPRRADEHHYYSVFGLSVRSDRPLPELSQRRCDTQDCDALIQRANLQSVGADSGTQGSLVRATSQEVILKYEQVGTVRIAHGTTIEYDARPTCSPETLRVVLLGICLGVLLHQRGLLVLHASAAAIEGRAVAFIGEKGWGKSTTAAAFHKAGYPLVTDDILPVELEEGERPFVWPGYPQMKLWADSLEGTLGGSKDTLEQVHPDIEKYLKQVSHLPQKQLPLGCICVLGFGEEIAIKPISGRIAFLQLLQHTYTRDIIDYTEASSRHLKQVTHLLRQVPAYHLVRPRGLEHLDHVVDCVVDIVK